jgi:hypothetical protein
MLKHSNIHPWEYEKRILRYSSGRKELQRRRQSIRCQALLANATTKRKTILFAATKDSCAENKRILRQKMTRTLKEEVTYSVEVTSSPIPTQQKLGNWFCPITPMTADIRSP